MTDPPTPPGRFALPFAGGEDRLRSLVGGRAADAAWVRPASLAVFLLTALLYVWGLDRNGYANTYYSAAVLAGTSSWKAFFFGAFDTGGFITVDKPPASLWLMALSGRVFGFSSWSLLLPEALLGVATVALLYVIVRRTFGPAAGLLAAVAMALTPVAVLMFRFNNPDALLTFLLVASAWALLRSIETGRTRWLLLSAGIVGLAFNTKYLQAYIALPALVVTYFALGPGAWPRRLGQLLAAAGALLVSSGWWMLAVGSIPAASRPFIGGSTDNTVLNLVLGYDGFGRLTSVFGSIGRGAAGAARAFGGGGGPGGGGQPGLLRLFNGELAGEISWLLPLAAVSLAVGLWSRRRAPRTDPARAAYVLWGLWLLTHAGVFSFASGIFHPYYTVAMAPAVAALVGPGAVDLWRLRSRSLAGGAIAAGALLATAWWGSRLLARTPDFAPGLGTLELALATLAAVLLLAPGGFRLPARLPAAALAIGLVAVLLGPAAYAVETAGRTESGGMPSSGPAAATAFGVGPGDGSRRFAGSGASFRIGPRGGGPGLTADPALISYLEQHQGGATWLVATSSAMSAAPIELATGRAVLAMGGFSGGDPAMTVSLLQRLVRSGQLRYVLVGGGPGGRGGGGRLINPGPGGVGFADAQSIGAALPQGLPGPAAGSQSVMAWVTQSCAAVDYSGSGGGGSSPLYDCSAAVGTAGPAQRR